MWWGGGGGEGGLRYFCFRFRSASARRKRGIPAKVLSLFRKLPVILGTRNLGWMEKRPELERSHRP